MPPDFPSSAIPLRTAAPSSLTVIEEFVLLAHEEGKGQFYPLAREAFDAATAGAVLMDLTLARRLDNGLTDIFVIDATPVGDDILDPALQVMALSPVLMPKPISEWLRRFGEEAMILREKTRHRLEARGIAGSGRRAQIRTRLAGILASPEIPLPRDVMLAALAEACGLLRHVLSDPEHAAARSRIEQVARMDLIGQAVARAAVGTAAA